MFETFDTLIANGEKAVTSLISLALIWFAFSNTKKMGFTLVSIVQVLATFGLVAWLVLGRGVFDVQEKIDQDINGAGNATQVLVGGTA